MLGSRLAQGPALALARAVREPGSRLQRLPLRLGKKTQLPLRLSTVTCASVKLTANGPMRQANFPAPADLKAGERFPEYITEVEAKKGDV